MRNEVFLIGESRNLIRNEPFLIRGSQNLIRNWLFLIGESLTLMRNESFLIRGSQNLNEEFVIPHSGKFRAKSGICPSTAAWAHPRKSGLPNSVAAGNLEDAGLNKISEGVAEAGEKA